MVKFIEVVIYHESMQRRLLINTATIDTVIEGNNCNVLKQLDGTEMQILDTIADIWSKLK